MESEETILLERKKLALEIADMERAWWKRPTYILAALPTLLALIALSVGFLNGFFGAQLTKLENQKMQLEFQRHDVEAQIKELEAKRDQIKHDMQPQLDSLSRDLSRCQMEAVEARGAATNCRLELALPCAVRRRRF